jgi:hypothetical protein
MILVRLTPRDKVTCPFVTGVGATQVCMTRRLPLKVPTLLYPAHVDQPRCDG